MKVLARVLLTAAVGVASVAAWAQAETPTAKWTAHLEPADARPGEHARVIVEGEFSKGGYVYSPDYDSYQIELAISAPDGAPFALEGKPLFPKPHIVYDKATKGNIGKFEGGLAFAVPVVLNVGAKGATSLNLKFQVCNERLCANPATIPLSFKISGSGAARSKFAAASTEIPKQPAGYIVPKDEPAPTGPVDDTQVKIEKAKSQGPVSFFFFAFAAGLLALLTPCVWPMIPVTVSFFSKSAGDKKKNLHGALAYCFGIIGTFTALGLIVTAVAGAAGTQLLAANPWVNLGMATLFVVLAASLFGVFELALPPALVNKMQKQTKAGGLIGPMMMGLVFSMTSFTCTVPFAGSVLASAAGGDWFYPTIGMLGFSCAFALPFFLLALFPQWMSKLPQSGTWLITVKGFLGFIELAAALKFLSNTDLVLGWRLLPKETFLAVWSILFAFAGMYLIGWIKLPKDMTTKIGVPRRVVGVLSVLTSLYFLGAIQGAPLGRLSGFMPSTSVAGTSEHALPWVKNFESARAQAEAEKRLLFINFTGVTCINCREMENNVFPADRVKSELEQFTLAELFTDRDIPEDRKNASLREKLTGSASNPIYVVMEPKTQKVIKVYQGAAPNHDDFINFLKSSRSGSAVAAR
jgi:thiol:disulfide interchange protein DsbD